MISPLMQRVSSYIAEARHHPLPDLITEATKHHFADTVAAMVSGVRLLPGERALAYAKATGGRKQACIPGTRIVTDVVTAALTGGMLAQAGETDDTHPLAGTHLGACVIPAALAMAERERSSGTALLRAIALGYDIGMRAALSVGGSDFSLAGHDPATVKNRGSFGGIFGAAAACASIAQFDADRIRYVLSYTGQQASGLSNFAQDLEHIEKAFLIGGMPSRNGAFAAVVAGLGWTGVNDVFSGDNNFFATHGPNVHPEALVAGLGESYEVAKTTIKRWPVGAPVQAPLDSLHHLISTHAVRAEDVERVVVRISHLGAYTVNNRSMANISMQHLAALMLIDGTVTFESTHDQSRLGDPAAMELRKRVELYGDDELDRAMPVRQGIVELKLRDGRELRHHTTAVRGFAENPMTREDVEEKCVALMSPVLGNQRAHDFIRRVWALEEVENVRELRDVLGA
jgi:2-methylcitrate dehydratase PrpD